jgi:hypothetical protein
MIRPFGITVPMSALVIGTMAPDFSYLLRLAPGGGAWHSRVGVFAYCLPAGVCVWLIYRTLIAPALLRLLPLGLGAAARALVAPESTWRLVPAAALAVVLGAISHDAWDGFTHPEGWATSVLPILHRNLHFSATGMVRWYLIFQYASSVLGLVAVVAILWRWVAAQPSSARYVPEGERAWRVRDLGLMLSFSAAGGVVNTMRPHPHTISWTLGYAAVGALAALALALLVYGITDAIRQRVRSRRITGLPDPRYEARGNWHAEYRGNQQVSEIVDAEAVHS